LDLRLAKGTGVSFNAWLGKLDKSVKDRVKFLQLREYYEDDLTPDEVKIKVDIDG
jgi:predicted nucleotidyltransferase